MRFARRTKLKAGKLDITPLVDVVLLLLIFFMLTSNMINRSGFRINLPETSVSLPAPDDPVIVTITQSGDIYFGDRLIPPDQLESVLRRHREAQDRGDLVIQADRVVSHGSVVDVMTWAKEAGWDSLAVMARPETERIP